jgi:hypothetical protein
LISTKGLFLLNMMNTRTRDDINGRETSAFKELAGDDMIEKPRDPILAVPSADDITGHALVEMGYPNPDAADREMRKKTGVEVMAITGIAGTRMISSTLIIDEHSGKVASPDIPSRLIREYLNRATGPAFMIAFAVTLGSGVEEYLAGLRNKDSILQSLMAESAASALAELFAEQIESHFSGELARMGLRASRRISPGFCDWPLFEGQNFIAGLIDLAEIGISISNSGMMIPRKSVTALMFGAQAVPFHSFCPLCGSATCAWRRE